MNKQVEKTFIITNEGRKCEMSKILYKNFMHNTKEHFYWLDLDSKLLMCNQAQADFFNTNIDDLIGKNTLEIGESFGLKKQDMEIIIKNNASVIKSKKSRLISELIEKDHTKIILSFKSPLVGENGEVIGIFGTSIDITSKYEMESYYQSLAADIFKITNLDIGWIENGKEKKLSFHESQCAVYLIQGKTTPQIAKILNEPQIKIERHIRNMKAKFSCKNRSELVEALLEHGLQDLLN